MLPCAAKLHASKQKKRQGQEGEGMSAYLQAADDAGLAVLDAGAEGLDLGGAGALHGILEVDVLRHAHLCVEQRRAALVAQLLARVLQASNHTRAALHQSTRNHRCQFLG